MKQLNIQEVTQVNGGVGAVGGFIISYAIGKVVDASIDGFIGYVNKFSMQDHTMSNQHFLQNRHDFNLML